MSITPSGLNPDKLESWLAFLENQPSAGRKFSDIKTIVINNKLNQHSCPIITIAGTNGKGSLVAALSHLFIHSGFNTAAYTSPHLIHFNERIKINSDFIENKILCDIFNKIYPWFENINYTYFDFITIAALYYFKNYKNKLDIIILEVGLGGRLDPVNAVDPTLSVITNIGLDHMDLLGNTIEKIAIEKAGILRKNGVCVLGQKNIPNSVAKIIKDLSVTAHYSNSTPMGMAKKIAELLHLSIQPDIPILDNLPGRCEIIYGDINYIIDVAHNTDAVNRLKNKLLDQKITGKIYAVFNCMQDKDAEGIIKIIANRIDQWHIGRLDFPRANSTDTIHDLLKKHTHQPISIHHSIHKAFLAAKAKASSGDWIVVFGSFHCVAEVLPL